MSLDQFSPEELIARFSYRPDGHINDMILISQPAQFPVIQHNVGTSSAGSLDCLLLELLHSICALLDVQSLSRVSRTSIQGKAIVESLPIYRDLMKYAPHTLTALGKTGLVSAHSSSTLHTALRSEKCVSCGEYGAFLFLPTCERVCYQCLLQNASFWAVSTRQARKYFNLTARQIKSAPVMRSIPGYYLCGSRHQRVRLISVKDAKKLAIMVHGSEDELKKLVLPRPPSYWVFDLKQEEAYHLSKWLTEAPFDPLPCDPLTIPKNSEQPENRWLGTASIHFPSLYPQKTLENGLWCCGCEHLDSMYWRMDSRTQSYLVPANVEPWVYLRGMQYRARSKAGFLEHIRKCHGIELLLSKSNITEESDDSAF